MALLVLTVRLISEKLIGNGFYLSFAVILFTRTTLHQERENPLRKFRYFEALMS